MSALPVLEGMPLLPPGNVELKWSETMKKRKNWISLFLVFLVLGILLAPPVCAGTGDDNDASYPEVGVEWINEYQAPSNDLPNSDDCAIGFYNVLCNAGWTPKFNKGTYTASALHWVWDGSDTTYVDGADIVFFAGHGWNCGILISTVEWMWFNDCEWGDYDAEWVLLHSCHTVQIPGEFKVSPHWALNGAHLICGFDTVGYDYPQDGGAIGSRLVSGNKIRHAWYLALDETHGSDVRAGIVGENAACGDDHIWGEGTVVADPPVDSEIYRWLYQCN